LEDIGGLLGKYKKNMSYYFIEDFPQSPFSSDFFVQNQSMYSNIPPPLDGQMQMAVSLLGYIAYSVSTLPFGM
jgi:hypothetical protein